MEIKKILQLEILIYKINIHSPHTHIDIYNSVLRGFSDRIISREGVLVHDFKNELIVATLPWILYLECESLIPHWTPTLTCTIDTNLLKVSTSSVKQLCMPCTVTICLYQGLLS